MTTPTPNDRPAAPAFRPVAAPRALGPRRVSKGLLSLAVFLVTTGGVLSAAAFYTVTDTHDFLAIARDVRAGARIDNADLTVVQVPDVSDLSLVSAGERSTIIGQRATVTLLRGQLLVSDAVTDKPIGGEGQRRVGIELEPGRMPAERLYPGDSVTLVELPDTKTLASAAKTQTAGQLGEWDATVVASGRPRQSDGSTVVYFAVEAELAADVGTVAAAGRVIVLLKSVR
ncbi:SAF domain-containing protein [Cryptosporangium aurantiacum]|uniref:SAF domain-containing protein n=1 Tax=Cryptosporangium aurantiacum TaxID=134849 RepID=A0A1M7PPS5_9ACTN|nr:SAF domain-containing protein [Cryptosporangium aurantiacum]SHN19342.1 SAF domain-containing protein [Cryptosporangium aurantiacum]